MVWCPLCEKKFKDRRGLHGHFRFVHGIEYGSGKPAKKTVLTEAINRSIDRKREGEKLYDLEKGSRLANEHAEGEKQEGKINAPIFRGFGGEEEYEREEKRERKGFIFRNLG